MPALTKLLAVLLCASLSIVSMASYADKGGNPGKGFGKGHGKGKSWHNVSPGKAGKKIGHSAFPRFSNADKGKINQFFKTNPSAFPASTLPPGIAKNLVRGKPLPPGIAKVFLPAGLLSTLPVYPGFQYLAVGNDVVLVNSATNVVADILTNALLR